MDAKDVYNPNIIVDEYTARQKLRCRLAHLLQIDDNYLVDGEDVDEALRLLSSFPQLASQKVTSPGSGPIYPLFVLIQTSASSREINQVYDLFPDAVLSNPEVTHLVEAGCDPRQIPALWAHNTSLVQTKLKINSNFRSLKRTDVEALRDLLPRIQSFTGDTPMGFDSPDTMGYLCNCISLYTVQNLTKLQLDIPHNIFKSSGNNHNTSTARTAFVSMLSKCSLNHLQLYCDNELEDLDETSNETMEALAEAFQSRGFQSRTSPIAFVRLQWFFLTTPEAVRAFGSVLSAPRGAKRLRCSDLHIVCPPFCWEKEDNILFKDLHGSSLREFHLTGDCSLRMNPVLTELARNRFLRQIHIQADLYDYQTEEEAESVPITEEVIQLLEKCPELEQLLLPSHSLPADLLHVASLLKRVNPTKLKELELSTSNDVEYMQTERQLKEILQVFETNRMLKTCKVHVLEWGETIRQYLDRIDYCAALNRAGRSVAGDPELELHTLIDLLLQAGSSDEARDEGTGTGARKRRRRAERRKTSIRYDLLRKNPALWSSISSW